MGDEASVAHGAVTLDTLDGFEAVASTILESGVAHVWSTDTLVDVHIALTADRDTVKRAHARIVDDAAKHFGVHSDSMRANFAEFLKDGSNHDDSAEEMVTHLNEYLDIAWDFVHPQNPAWPLPNSEETTEGTEEAQFEEAPDLEETTEGTDEEANEEAEEAHFDGALFDDSEDTADWTEEAHFEGAPDLEETAEWTDEAHSEDTPDLEEAAVEARRYRDAVADLAAEGLYSL